LRQILTSGSDGKVTVWDSLDDEEQTKTYKIGGQPTCLALRVSFPHYIFTAAGKTCNICIYLTKYTQTRLCGFKLLLAVLQIGSLTIC